MAKSVAAPGRERTLIPSGVLSPDERQQAASVLRSLTVYLGSESARLTLLDLANAIEQGADIDARLKSAARKHYGGKAAA